MKAPQDTGLQRAFRFGLVAKLAALYMRVPRSQSIIMFAEDNARPRPHLRLHHPTFLLQGSREAGKVPFSRCSSHLAIWYHNGCQKRTSHKQIIATYPFIYLHCKGMMSHEGEDDTHENRTMQRAVTREDALGHRELYARLNCLQGA